MTAHLCFIVRLYLFGENTAYVMCFLSLLYRQQNEGALSPRSCCLAHFVPSLYNVLMLPAVYMNYIVKQRPKQQIRLTSTRLGNKFWSKIENKLTQRGCVDPSQKHKSCNDNVRSLRIRYNPTHRRDDVLRWKIRDRLCETRSLVIWCTNINALTQHANLKVRFLYRHKNDAHGLRRHPGPRLSKCTSGYFRTNLYIQTRQTETATESKEYSH